MPDRSPAQIRAFVFDLSAARGTDGGIPVVLSTDAVVDVQDGPEILVHSADAIDLSRAPLPIIPGHGGGQVNVGEVRDLVAVNGQLRGMARFGERPEAAGYHQDVLKGIIRSVSVGYQRIRAKLRNDGVLVTSRWMPTHAAMVAEPADINAGFFRARDDAPAFVIETEASASAAAQPAQSTRAIPATTAKEIQMDQTTQTAAPPAAAAQPAQPIDAGQMERIRTTGVLNLARQNYGAGVNITEEMRQKWINEGASCDDVGKEILGLIQVAASRQVKDVAVGMSPKETQNYSVWKALRAAATSDWKDAGLELEVTRALCGKLNRTPDNGTLLIPFEALTRPAPSVGDPRASYIVGGRRDISVAANGGGYLVETQNVGFIEMLRNRSVALRMGATRLTGLVGNVTIPKQSATATAYWLSSETATVTESSQTFVQVPLSPKTAGAYTEISRLLLLQSSPDAEGIVTRDLAAVVGTAVDLGVIAGTAAGGQPQGIIGTSGVGSVTGTSFDYADILEFQSDVATANVQPMSGGYVATPTVAALAMARSRFANTDTPLWEGNLWDGRMAGFPAMSSMQVPTGDMLFGDWSTVVVAEWGVLELAVNPQANFAAGIIGIRALYSMDVGVRIPAAFSLMTSAT